MSMFILDTKGDQKLLEGKGLGISQTSNVGESDGVSEGSSFAKKDVDISSIIAKALAKQKHAKPRTEKDHLDEVSDLVDAAVESRRNAAAKVQRRRKRVVDLDHSDFNEETGKFEIEGELKTNTQHVLETSVLKPGFDALKAVPQLTDKQRRDLNRIERSKTKGKNWFNLPATEQTEEIKNDLKLIQMRSVLDPKHFYKKNDLKVLPKYFQIGTVQHSPLDFYNERDTRKNKKKSIVEEMLADTSFQSYNKRKYNEIISRRDKYAHRKALKKMKKLKKQK